MSESIEQLSAGKPVAIFGTGVSGMAVKSLLDFLGIKSEFYSEDSHSGKADLPTREFTEADASRHSLVVYSPAFRPDHRWIKTAENAGAEAVCEPDLSYLAWRGKIIAVTGTNGKTTLTSFLTHAMKFAGMDAVAAGNIGRPLGSLCLEFGGDENKIAVCELSSFQTARLKFLRPSALLWTNFAPDHLDWHADIGEYFLSKFNLVESTTSGTIVVGSDAYAEAEKYGRSFPKYAGVVDNSKRHPAPPPFDNSIQSKNFAMAVEFGKSEGIREEVFWRAAETFSLPAHRFSTPITRGGIRFFNDSKATNVHAAVAALNELGNEPDLIWIGGGKDKNCDLSELVETLRARAKAAVLIGQSADKLSRALKDKLKCGAYICKSMKEAVEKSCSLAGKNSAVLFSPAFSSFGMFSGYVERGKSFENEVLCLKNLK